MDKTKILLDEILKICRGEAWPKLTCDFQEDARYNYPKKIQMIINLINLFKQEETQQ